MGSSLSNNMNSFVSDIYGDESYDSRLSQFIELSPNELSTSSSRFGDSQDRPGDKYFSFIVMRHGERADTAWDIDWACSEECSQYPYDPPLSKAGRETVVSSVFNNVISELKSELSEHSLYYQGDIYQGSSKNHELKHLRNQRFKTNITKKNRTHKISLVVASPYTRCVETGSIFSKKLNIPLILSEAFGEVCGPHAMKIDDMDTLCQEERDEFSAKLKNPHRNLRGSMRLLTQYEATNITSSPYSILGTIPEYPEALWEARYRFVRGFARYLTRSFELGHTPLIVTHADAVSTLLSLIGNVDVDHITRVVVTGHIIVNVNVSKFVRLWRRNIYGYMASTSVNNLPMEYNCTSNLSEYIIPNSPSQYATSHTESMLPKWLESEESVPPRCQTNYEDDRMEKEGISRCLSAPDILTDRKEFMTPEDFLKCITFKTYGISLNTASKENKVNKCSKLLIRICLDIVEEMSLFGQGDFENAFNEADPTALFFDLDTAPIAAPSNIFSSNNAYDSMLYRTSVRHNSTLQSNMQNSPCYIRRDSVFLDAMKNTFPDELPSIIQPLKEIELNRLDSLVSPIRHDDDEDDSDHSFDEHGPGAVYSLNDVGLGRMPSVNRSSSKYSHISSRLPSYSRDNHRTLTPSRIAYLRRTLWRRQKGYLSRHYNLSVHPQTSYLNKPKLTSAVACLTNEPRHTISIPNIEFKNRFYKPINVPSPQLPPERSKARRHTCEVTRETAMSKLKANYLHQGDVVDQVLAHARLALIELLEPTCLNTRDDRCPTVENSLSKSSCLSSQTRRNNRALTFTDIQPIIRKMPAKRKKLKTMRTTSTTKQYSTSTRLLQSVNKRFNRKKHMSTYLVSLRHEVNGVSINPRLSLPIAQVEEGPKLTLNLNKNKLFKRLSVKKKGSRS